jgi:uncharacterized repeat protein (TIGR02543 family)
VVEYNAFAACTATIYCEAASRPVGWSSDWNSGLFGQVLWGQAGLPAPPDTEGPVLGAASAARRSASVAAVSFAGSEAGSYYWAVVAQGAPAPAIGTAGAGTPLKAGPQTLEVTGLADGRAWDVCLIAKDAAGNLGTVTRVGVPAWAYTVAFRGWDGRALGVPQRVSHGLGAVAPKAPARTGHTFVGWDRGFASVTTDLTVTAKYRADTCTVRLDANGGKVAGKAATSVKKTYGSALGKLPTPVRTGYSFQGWYTGKVKGTKVGSATKVTKAATYYAHWKAKGPVVTLDANGGKVGKAATASVVRSKGKAMGRLATPTRAGYSFLGWFTGKVKGTRVTAATKATRSVTLYAHWKAKSYTVRLNANGGKVGKASVFSTKKSHNSKFGRLAIPKRTGYQFLGWYTGKAKGTKVTASTKVTKAVTLYAHWKRVR